MAKYVKTDYVPFYVDYIKVNKEYAIHDDTDGFGGYITNEKGRLSFIKYKQCAHLDDKDWTVINR